MHQFDSLFTKIEKQIDRQGLDITLKDTLTAHEIVTVSQLEINAEFPYHVATYLQERAGTPEFINITLMQGARCQEVCSMNVRSLNSVDLNLLQSNVQQVASGFRI